VRLSETDDQGYYGISDVPAGDDYAVILPTTSAGLTAQSQLVVGLGADQGINFVPTADAVPPVITTVPSSQTVDEGEEVHFDVGAVGTGPLHYTWYHDGTELQNEVQRELAIRGVTVFDAGFYSVVVSSSEGIASAQPFELVVRGAKVANISTRMTVGTADQVLIGGFIVTGGPASSKRVVVRALGPSLSLFGLSGALSDPILKVYDAAHNELGSNDNWGSSPAAGEITGLQLEPADPLESIVMLNLAPGNYTAIVGGSDGGTGVGLIEIYDVDASSEARLGNISTRGFVNTGDNVMIGGTIIVGSSPTNVLVRAIGPSLSNFGVPNALQDPVLELHDGDGAIIALNDNWRESQEAAITATGIPPTDNRESAILANLPPGQYTAVVRGTGNSTGVALVEAYQLQ
jgi:hypothetical protein